MESGWLLKITYILVNKFLLTLNLYCYSTHYIIHVPYEVKVHTVHHHHIKKVPVYIKEHHEDHHEDHSHKEWDWD